MSIFLTSGFVLAIAGQSDAKPQPPSVVIVGEDKEPESLVPEPSTHNIQAVVRVPVEARASGQLSASFIDLSDDEATAMESSLDPPGGNVNPGDLAVFTLTFQSTDNSRLTDLEGIVSFRVGGGLPLVREVKAADADGAGSTPNAWAPTQGEITIELKRDGPWGGIEDVSDTIGLLGGTTRPAEPLASSYVTLDQSGGGTLTVDVPDEVVEGGVTETDLDLTDFDGLGSATTTLKLDGTESKDDQKLKVNVKVGDALWFPLLVVILGSLIGKLFPTLYSVRRKSTLARLELEKSAAKYFKARDSEDEGTFGLEGIGEQVGSDGFEPAWHWWVPWLWKLNPERFPKDDKTAKAVDYRLGVVRSTRKLEEVLKDAESLTNTIESWTSMRTALLALGKAVPKKTLPEPADRSVVRDGQALLVREFKVDDDVTSWSKIAKAIHVQATLVELHNQIVKVALGVPALPMILPNGTSLVFFYEKFPPPLLRTEAQGEELIETFSALAGRLEVWRKEPREANARFNLLRLRKDEEPGETVGPQFDLTKLIAAFLGPRKASSADRLMASVIGGDWLAFLVVLLITAFGLATAVYSSTFGSTQEYLTLFVSGLVAQATITGAAIPLARSYEKEPEEEGKETKKVVDETAEVATQTTVP